MIVLVFCEPPFNRAARGNIFLSLGSVQLLFPHQFLVFVVTFDTLPFYFCLSIKTPLDHVLCVVVAKLDHPGVNLAALICSHVRVDQEGLTVNPLELPAFLTLAVALAFCLALARPLLGPSLSRRISISLCLTSLSLALA